MMYRIYVGRDGNMAKAPWATTDDLDSMIDRIEEVEGNFEGCDFIAIDEEGNHFMLTSEWEPIDPL